MIHYGIEYQKFYILSVTRACIHALPHNIMSALPLGYSAYLLGNALNHVLQILLVLVNTFNSTEYLVLEASVKSGIGAALIIT